MSAKKEKTHSPQRGRCHRHLPASLDGEIDKALRDGGNVGVCNKDGRIARDNVGKDQVARGVLLDVVAVDAALSGPLQRGALHGEVAAGGVGELDSLLAGRGGRGEIRLGGILRSCRDGREQADCCAEDLWEFTD